MWPVADLHCDLLSFLAEGTARHTIHSPESLASYPQMRQGGVCFQTLAIFTETEGIINPFTSGQRQLKALRYLLQSESNKYTLWNPSIPLLGKEGNIHVLPSFENADGFAEATQPMKEVLLYLDSLIQEFPHFLYISLTWNGENRFGGGCGSKVGLKEEGKQLLDWMHGKHIAVDLSHASDYLADAIFNHIDKRSLQIPVIASHSNARAITPQERNLPDFIAKEIFLRKGIVGLNFFAPFIGDNKHLLEQHALHFFSLGGKNLLCFGADFFPIEKDRDLLSKKFSTQTLFFPSLSNASCYPHATTLFPSFSKEEIQALCHKNFLNYIERITR